MNKIYLVLSIASFSLLCLNPVAVQSQERSTLTPVNSTEQLVRETEQENTGDRAAPDSVNQVSPELLEQQDEENSEIQGEQPEESRQAIEALYTQLEQYLSNQETWQDADHITYELMLLIAGSSSQELGYFDSAEWENFPCEEFQRIDSLWREASQGQQGFLSQLTIFREVGGNSFDYFNRIGWKQGEQWLVDWEYDDGERRASYLADRQPDFANPPAGHLPALLQWRGAADYRLAKAASCQM